MLLSLLRRRALSLASTRTDVSSSLLATCEPGGHSLLMTEPCVQKLERLSQEDPTVALRLAVDSGGCSGFVYTFALDSLASRGEDDLVFRKGNASILVDSASMDMLEGATVDYELDLVRQGFVVQGNPNSENACGCKTSFLPRGF